MKCYWTTLDLVSTHGEKTCQTKSQNTGKTHYLKTKTSIFKKNLNSRTGIIDKSWCIVLFYYPHAQMLVVIIKVWCLCRSFTSISGAGFSMQYSTLGVFFCFVMALQNRPFKWWSDDDVKETSNSQSALNVLHSSSHLCFCCCCFSFMLCQLSQWVCTCLMNLWLVGW